MDIKALGAFEDIEEKKTEERNEITDADEFTIATLITFKDGARLFYLAEEDGLDQQAVENAYENTKYEYSRLDDEPVVEKLKGIKFKVEIEYVSTLWEMWDSFVDNTVPFIDASKENSGRVVAIEVIDSYGYSDEEEKRFEFDKLTDGDKELGEVLDFIFGEIGVSEEDAIEAATKLFFSEVLSGKVTKVVDIYSRIGNIMDIKEKIDNPEAEFSEYDILEERKAKHLDQFLFFSPDEFKGWVKTDNLGVVLKDFFNVSYSIMQLDLVEATNAADRIVTMTMPDIRVKVMAQMFGEVVEVAIRDIISIKISTLRFVAALKGIVF